MLEIKIGYKPTPKLRWHHQYLVRSTNEEGPAICELPPFLEQLWVSDLQEEQPEWRKIDIFVSQANA